jgi:hypothetical protein
MFHTHKNYNLKEFLWNIVLIAGVYARVLMNEMC